MVCVFCASIGKCVRCQDNDKYCRETPAELRGRVAAMRAAAASDLPDKEVVPRIKQGISAINAWFYRNRISQMGPNLIRCVVVAPAVASLGNGSSLARIECILRNMKNNMANYLEMVGATVEYIEEAEEEGKHLIDE